MLRDRVKAGNHERTHGHRRREDLHRSILAAHTGDAAREPCVNVGDARRGSHLLPRAESRSPVIIGCPNAFPLTRRPRPGCDALVDRLYERCDEIEDDPECRVVILTGAGRGFCAGLDLTGFGAAPRQKGWGGPGFGLAVQQHIAGLMPRLRGPAATGYRRGQRSFAGGGLALALASDVRVCSESARFNVAFVRIGLSGCDVGVSWLLPRLIGASRATEMMLTGRLISAAEADKYGLVSEVVPDGETVNSALNIVDQICANSPFGVWMTKEASWAPARYRVSRRPSTSRTARRSWRRTPPTNVRPPRPSSRNGRRFTNGSNDGRGSALIPPCVNGLAPLRSASVCFS